MSKLDGIKAGDMIPGQRYRITMELEAITKDSDLDWWFTATGEPRDQFWVRPSALETAEITRIEPAFKLGDLVKVMGWSGIETIVAFLSDGRAVLEYDAGDTTGVCARDVSTLTHA